MCELQTSRLTVYYDGACPLCQREIGFYRRRRGADRISWFDVSEGVPATAGLSCEEAMARFHVRDANGRLLDGGDAFSALWRELPAFRWIGRLAALPPLRQMLNIGYNVFLKVRPRLQSAFGGGAS